MVFVINRALVRDPRGFGRRCVAAAGNFGWEPVLAETSPGESGLGLARQAVAGGAGLVFAAGGDGTVRACAQALAGTGIPLAIVPLGTANLTARALGVPARPAPAIEVGFRGRDHRIDLASAELGVGVDEGTLFAAMAGIGLDAAVVGAAHAAGKRRLGWVAYAVSGVAHLSLPPREFTVRLDGGEPLVRRARCVVVGNAGLLPGGFLLLPEARCDDGWLDVGILAPTGVLGWPRVAGLVLTRSRRAGGQLERFRARRVEIGAAMDLPRQIDGEVIAPGRALTVTVRPGVLTVRLGRSGRPGAGTTARSGKKERS
ncbi:MAG: diacylglycerol/lipid kinase family protein [Streptosporangiaceae bacterium]